MKSPSRASTPWNETSRAWSPNSQVTNRDRLGLRDLESAAKVYHTLYDSFLQRYMEAIQQQSFPITEARVISAAAPPQHKSSPLTLKVLGIAGAIGLVLSFGTALLREAIDRVFRTARQVETNLHARCLAVLPLLVASKSSKAKHSIAVRAGQPQTDWRRWSVPSALRPWRRSA